MALLNSVGVSPSITTTLSQSPDRASTAHVTTAVGWECRRGRHRTVPDPVQRLAGCTRNGGVERDRYGAAVAVAGSLLFGRDAGGRTGSGRWNRVAETELAPGSAGPQLERTGPAGRNADVGLPRLQPFDDGGSDSSRAQTTVVGVPPSIVRRLRRVIVMPPTAVSRCRD